MVDVSYIIITITVQMVIMGITAVIVAEFFICTAMEHTVTAKTNFGFCDHPAEFECGFKQLLK